MTIPPPPQQPQGPYGVPPGRFAPTPPPSPEPRRRELGEDPSLARSRRRPWLPWVIIGVGAVALIALVVAILVPAFSTSGGTIAPDAGSTGPAAPPSANPSSTLATATPVAPPAGATIPITMDVSFPDGITFVMPGAGDWRQSTNDRQPDALQLEDPQSGAYLQVLETTQPASTYRDEDLTRSFLNRAPGSFTGNAQNAGAPTSYFVSGSGYRLELLSQRVEWAGDSQAALVISRMMPGANSSIQIYVIAEKTDLDNPNSRLWQKLGELAFTVP